MCRLLKGSILSMEEIILVDTNDIPIGSCEKLAAHKRPTLHRAFSIFLYSDGKMLLQKRNHQKYHSGGLWTNACCSHQRTYETLGDAAARRLQEEMGVSVPIRELCSFIYFARFSDTLFEYEYDHVFLGEFRGNPIFDPAEAEAVRWVRFSDLRKELVMHPEQFTVWFLSAAPKVLDYLEQPEPPAGPEDPAAAPSPA